MIAIRGLLTFVFALCVSSGGAALSADRIVWMVSSKPPAFIESGPLAAQGYGDRQLAFLEKSLPQFKHAVIHASLARIWSAIGSEDNVCTLLAGRTEQREAVAAFAHHPFYSVPNRVILPSGNRPRLEPYLDDQGAVDLAKLAQAADIRGAYDPGAHYGNWIDAFIADSARRTVLEKIPNMSMPVRMLLSGRIDYIFGYPFEMNYAFKTAGLTGDFISLPVKGERPYNEAHIACSNRGEGLAAIGAINALLDEPENRAAFTKSLEEWYPPDDFRAALLFAN